MSVTSGYGRTGLSGTVSLNVDKAQGRLQANASRLSSGLRINNASDDPSGLAISETLKSKVNGFDQAVSNVQDATNAATVAEGALQTTTDILQRIRTLAVEAANDVLSRTDRTKVQTEITELLHEVDQVSQGTKFNGLPLLDGTYAGSTPQQPATINIASNAALASGSVSPAAVNLITNPNFSLPAVGTGSSTPLQFTTTDGWFYYCPVGSSGVYNGAANIAGTVAPTPPDGQQAAYLNPAAFEVASVTTDVNLIAGHTYTINIDAAASTGSTWDVSLGGTNGGSSDLTPGGQAISGGFAIHSFQMTATSTGPWQLALETGNDISHFVYLGNVSVTDNALSAPTGGLLVSSAVAANANFATTAGGIAGLGGTGTGDGSIELQVINTGTSIAAQETFINSATGAISVSPTLLAPNSTSTLFDNVAISTGNFATPDVGVTSYVKVSQNVPPSIGVNPALSVHSGADEGNIVNVQLPAVSSSALRLSNVNVVSSYDGNPSLAAGDAIGQIDHALSSLLTQRAQLGAFMVRLRVEASNDNVAGVNLQAAESNIRDANIAQETTAYTSDQILISVGTSVLAQSGTNGKAVEALFQ